MVKAQGPHGRALGIPQEPPRELPPGPESLGALMTPTTRIVVWMFRRPNCGWALPSALVLVPAYLVAAGLLQSYFVPADGPYLIPAWLCVYNAAKFALTGTIASLIWATTSLTHLTRRLRRPRRRRPSPAQVRGPLPTIWRSLADTSRNARSELAPYQSNLVEPQRDEAPRPRAGTPHAGQSDAVAILPLPELGRVR